MGVLTNGILAPGSITNNYQNSLWLPSTHLTDKDIKKLT
ncbi:MAG: hypothetical protein BAJALOKI2v1_70008 [Promethearchaeota archaeon]|nr:MAG: hypothetical protein BAJALOKI2v1_70008 [Candidatus Lokiarchaeota archaeon]